MFAGPPGGIGAMYLTSSSCENEPRAAWSSVGSSCALVSVQRAGVCPPTVENTTGSYRSTTRFRVAEVPGVESLNTTSFLGVVRMSCLRWLSRLGSQMLLRRSTHASAISQYLLGSGNTLLLPALS